MFRESLRGGEKVSEKVRISLGRGEYVSISLEVGHSRRNLKLDGVSNTDSTSLESCSTSDLKEKVKMIHECFESEIVRKVILLETHNSKLCQTR